MATAPASVDGGTASSIVPPEKSLLIARPSVSQEVSETLAMSAQKSKRRDMGFFNLDSIRQTSCQTVHKLTIHVTQI